MRPPPPPPPQRRAALMLALLAHAQLPRHGAGGGHASCPCIEAFSGHYEHTPAGAGLVRVELASRRYSYPNTYGLRDCDAHDSGLPPYCDATTPPEWCANSWCYVDMDNCAYVAQESTYFPGLRYSYQTCGASNSFDAWFGDNAASDGSHQLTDIADVVEGYLRSVVEATESNYMEIQGGSLDCSLPEACSCTRCVELAGWDPATNFDVQTATFWQRPGSSSAADTLRVDKCLAAFASDSFTRVAAKEANASRVGYAYAGSQANGNYVQWPGTDWCPQDYDPRFRPWYAAAASGPKDVVIVLDTSGSMRSATPGGDGPEKMARDAAKAVIDTLTDVDYVTLVGFSTDAYAYSTELRQATDSERDAMKRWVDLEIGANGATNYRAAFEKTFEIIAASTQSTSNCNRVVLFMSDGDPSIGSWGEADFADVSARADLIGNVHILTYALGTNINPDILKRIACENSGVAYRVPDNMQLADTMASYYEVISPMQPCQIRWVSYTELITSTTLMAACLASYKPVSSAALSCNGGFSGLGEPGDGRIAELLGVSCIDLNMLVSLETIQARSDWSTFADRVNRERALCPISGLNDAQMETIRAAVSWQAKCSGWTYGSTNRVRSDGVLGDFEDEGESVNGVLIVVSVAAAVVLIAALICYCMRRNTVKPNPAPVSTTRAAPPPLSAPGFLTSGAPRPPPYTPHDRQQAPQARPVVFAQPVVAQAVAVPQQVQRVPTATVQMP